ncbi:hypothetical protein H8959_002718 [Pygathrix nigripes]
MEVTRCADWTWEDERKIRMKDMTKVSGTGWNDTFMTLEEADFGGKSEFYLNLLNQMLHSPEDVSDSEGQSGQCLFQGPTARWQFFPYILLLFAILLYLPPLFWRFAAAPHICSDLKFIMEELDKVYNRAIKAAKSACDLDMRDGACSVPGVAENLGQRSHLAKLCILSLLTFI